MPTLGFSSYERILHLAGWRDLAMRLFREPWALAVSGTARFHGSDAKITPARLRSGFHRRAWAGSFASKGILMRILAQLAVDHGSKMKKVK